MPHSQGSQAHGRRRQGLQGRHRDRPQDGLLRRAHRHPRFRLAVPVHHDCPQPLLLHASRSRRSQLPPAYVRLATEWVTLHTKGLTLCRTLQLRAMSGVPEASALCGKRPSPACCRAFSTAFWRPAPGPRPR
jgi:hypothetical protein